MTGTMEVEIPSRRERGPMLRPFIARLINALSQQAQHEGSVKVGVKQYTVEVSPWELGVVLQLRDQGLRSTNQWSLRLLEALAVQTKGYADLHRLLSESPPGEQAERCRHDLVADVALGRALETELSAAITAFDEAERKGAAKNLVAARHRLSETMTKLEAVLSPAEQEQARQLVPGIVVPLEGLPARVERSVPAPVATPRAAPRRPAKDRSRLYLALIGLMTFLLVAALTFLLPVLTQRFDVNQALLKMPGVRGYEGTPPRATVTVAAETWKTLDPSARTRLVSAVGAAVRRAGYSSAVVVTPDRRPVAEWVNNRGSTIY